MSYKAPRKSNTKRNERINRLKQLPLDFLHADPKPRKVTGNESSISSLASTHIGSWGDNGISINKKGKRVVFSPDPPNTRRLGIRTIKKGLNHREVGTLTTNEYYKWLEGTGSQTGSLASYRRANQLKNAGKRALTHFPGPSVLKQTLPVEYGIAQELNQTLPVDDGRAQELRNDTLKLNQTLPVDDGTASLGTASLGTENLVQGIQPILDRDAQRYTNLVSGFSNAKARRAVASNASAAAAAAPGGGRRRTHHKNRRTKRRHNKKRHTKRRR
jgi:hypothetical protein